MRHLAKEREGGECTRGGKNTREINDKVTGNMMVGEIWGLKH